ncbi:ribosomal L28e protein family-domain-containing protein [Lentinula guzmanii]|uniref:Ribosomal L28e protein family-domain-containing protein n=1 Tax=Lentinula guzmanii TaxID=2804957 RepID=A0AA38JVK1_9AGAR|nr:ribosomal L28e protein family-domain-containing protein [Lentinula guzmanii]
MSSDLQWLLLRKSNSYIVKGLPEGPIFSKEPGNLLNLHSHKYSGLANAKTIDVSDVNGKITVTTRKPKASPYAVAPARSTSSIRSRSGSRRALGIIASHSKRGYRPDLRKVSGYISLIAFYLSFDMAPASLPSSRFHVLSIS